MKGAPRISPHFHVLSKMSDICVPIMHRGQIVDRIKLQAWLNAIAAGLTGLSAALQSIVLLIS